MKFTRLIPLLFLLIESPAWAWGRRGHSIVCQTAAYLIASEHNAAFLKNHSFDLGYYCNVPDVIWKEPPSGKIESPNHYINLEVFEREIGAEKLSAALALDRKAFAAVYPKILEKNGRVYWRIRELNDSLSAVHDKLSAKDLKKEDQRLLQAQWLQIGGFLGHYVGDLSMPLHVTENHNGALTHQEGVHSFYEDTLVNELFNDSDGFKLEAETASAAGRRWKSERARLAQKTILELMHDISLESRLAAIELLKVDREIGRDLPKAKKAHKKMIVKNLAAGSVYLAEFYRRGLGFDFDDDKFYTFVGAPAHIPPPQ